MGVRMKFLIVGFISLLLLGSPATADVIYNWEELTPSPAGIQFKGRISIDDFAWRSGGPLVGLDATPDLSCESGGVTGMFRPFFDPNSAEDPCYHLAFYTHYSLGIRNDGVLTGYLYYFDSGMDFEVGMGGADIWDVSVFTFGAFGTGCNYLPREDCSGATGRWVLDRSTIPVPEPTLVFLVAIGLAGLSLRAFNMSCGRKAIQRELV